MTRDDFRAEYGMARAVIRLGDWMLLSGRREPGRPLSICSALAYGPGLAAACRYGDPLRFPSRRDEHGRYRSRISGRTVPIRTVNGLLHMTCRMYAQQYGRARRVSP